MVDTKPLDIYVVDLVNEISKDLFCAICLKLMRNAVELPCGHGFCEECLKQSMERSRVPMCPHCGKAVGHDEVKPASMIRRLILAQIVRCSNSKYGCDWTGKLSNMQIHLSDACIFVIEKCPYRGCAVMRMDFDHHTKNCDWRIVACEYCKEKHPFITLQKHYKTCRSYPIVCPEKCHHTVTIRRSMLAEHLKFCPNLKISCTYDSVGCTEVMMRKDLEEHCRASIELHMRLLLIESKADKKKNKTLKKRLVTLENTLQTVLKMMKNFSCLDDAIAFYESCENYKLWRSTDKSEEYGTYTTASVTGQLFVFNKSPLANAPFLLNWKRPKEIFHLKYSISLHCYVSGKDCHQLKKEGFLSESLEFLLVLEVVKIDTSI